MLDLQKEARLHWLPLDGNVTHPTDTPCRSRAIILAVAIEGRQTSVAQIMIPQTVRKLQYEHFLALKSDWSAYSALTLIHATATTAICDYALASPLIFISSFSKTSLVHDPSRALTIKSCSLAGAIPAVSGTLRSRFVGKG
jgi:hypothetical protein